MNPNQRPTRPQVPDGQWTINKEEKGEVLALGRKLNAWLLDQAKEQGVTFHMKLIAGAVQYVMDLHKRKADIVADYPLVMEKAFADAGLGNELEEPFNEPEPEVIDESPAARKQRLLDDLAIVEEQIAAAEADPEKAEVEDASVAPGAAGVPLDAPTQ